MTKPAAQDRERDVIRTPGERIALSLLPIPHRFGVCGPPYRIPPSENSPLPEDIHTPPDTQLRLAQVAPLKQQLRTNHVVASLLTERTALPMVNDAGWFI